MSWTQVVRDYTQSPLPQKESQKDAYAYAENGHAEPEAGHRAGRVSGPQEAVRASMDCGGVHRFGSHLQRVLSKSGDLKKSNDPIDFLMDYFVPSEKSSLFAIENPVNFR